MHRSASLSLLSALPGTFGALWVDSPGHGQWGPAPPITRPPPGFGRAVCGLCLWKPLLWRYIENHWLQLTPGANGFLEQQFASAATWELGLVDQRVN